MAGDRLGQPANRNC